MTLAANKPKENSPRFILGLPGDEMPRSFHPCSVREHQHFNAISLNGKWEHVGDAHERE